MPALAGKIEGYALDNGSPPTRLEDLITKPGNAANWMGPYAKESDLKDPFGHPFQYKAPGEHGDFDIMFLGKDRPGRRRRRQCGLGQLAVGEDGNRESGIGNGERRAQNLPRGSLVDCAAIPDSRFPIPHSRTTGFTLIELMAVILLLAIAMTAVTFSFSKSLRTAKITGGEPRSRRRAALHARPGDREGEQEVLLLNLDDNSYTAPGKHAVKLPADMTLRLTTAEQEVTGGNSAAASVSSPTEAPPADTSRC